MQPPLGGAAVIVEAKEFIWYGVRSTFHVRSGSLASQRFQGSFRKPSVWTHNTDGTSYCCGQCLNSLIHFGDEVFCGFHHPLAQFLHMPGSFYPDLGRAFCDWCPTIFTVAPLVTEAIANPPLALDFCTTRHMLVIAPGGLSKSWYASYRQ